MTSKTGDSPAVSDSLSTIRPGCAIVERVIVRHPSKSLPYVESRGLIDTGADRSVILGRTSAILTPPRGKDVELTGAARQLAGAANPASRTAPTFRVSIEIPGLDTWSPVEVPTFEHDDPKWNAVYGVIIGQDILRDCTLLVIGPNVLAPPGSFTLTLGLP